MTTRGSMATKPAVLPRGGDWDDAGDAPVEESPAGGRRLDAVVEVLAALPANDAGRTLKLALLDALEASTRADRLALPVEVQGLRARVRAGTI
jgi:hypothetical protein